MRHDPHREPDNSVMPPCRRRGSDPNATRCEWCLWHDGAVVDTGRSGRWSRASRDALAGAAGALIGEAGLGPGGAVLGATFPVYALAALDEFGARWNSRRRGNAIEMLQSAAEEVGGTIQSVLDSASTPEAEFVVGLAVEAAANTAMRAKIRALGTALGRALAEDLGAQVSEDALVLAALAEIELNHARLLREMARSTNCPSPPTDGADWIHVATYAPGLDRRMLTRRLPGFEIAIDGAISVLQRHGLISEIAIDYVRLIDERATNSARTIGTTNPARSWRITALGVSTLRVLVEAGDDWAGEESEG